MLRRVDMNFLLFPRSGRAFIVRNEEKNELECVEVSIKQDPDANTVATGMSMNSTNEHQLDNRLRIAHKDIRNVNMDEDSNELDESYTSLNDPTEVKTEDSGGGGGGGTLATEEEEIEEEEEEVVEEEEEEILEEDEEDEYEEEDEEEEIIEDEDDIDDEDEASASSGQFFREDSELAAATTNLMADLQQDDEFNLDFSFS